MLNKVASAPHKQSVKRYAKGLLLFWDMWDCPKENAFSLNGDSDILRFYESLEELTGKIRRGEKIEVVGKCLHANGGLCNVPGRDCKLLVRCLKINQLTLGRYNLLPDMDIWFGLLRQPEFSSLGDTLVIQRAVVRDAADRAHECLAQFREIITSNEHRKRCYNAAGNAKRRQSTIMESIEMCSRFSGQVDFGLIDLSWNLKCRMRKSLNDTNSAYERFANGIRRHSVSKDLLAAIFCVEFSDSKGFHISGLLLLECGGIERTADIGRYWRDHVTAGEGGFLCATDKPFSAILSKWSGLPIEALAFPAGRQGDHARLHVIEAAVAHFAELSQKLCASGDGRKHRQLRIFGVERFRKMRDNLSSVEGRGGVK